MGGHGGRGDTPPTDNPHTRGGAEGPREPLGALALAGGGAAAPVATGGAAHGAADSGGQLGGALGIVIVKTK